MSDHDDDFAGLDPVGAAPEGAPDAAPEADQALAAQIARASDFDLNDDGNGRRFALYFGDDLLWVPRIGWHVWSGQVWRKDEDEIEVRKLSQQVAPLVKREVFALALPPAQMQALEAEAALLDERALRLRDTGEDGKPVPEAAARLSVIDAELRSIERLKKRLGDLRAAHRRFAVQTGNSARMKSMREEAAVRLSRRLEEMDASPLELNTESGVLRFSVTREDGRRYAQMDLLAHERGQLMTKMMPVRYDPDAECPEFDRFFARIQPDPRMRDFLLRWFALGMTGLIEQKLCYFYGMGANGKSVLVDLMARILGDYAATAKIESLTGTNRRGGGDATPDLVPLIGARMVRAAEPDEGMRWQEGLIKDLTGGEPILVRALHSDFVEVRPCFSLTISGNHRPDIRGTDDGIWRRLLLVPFDVQIPRDEQIPKADLDALLFAERDGIFARLVQALCAYLEIGLGEPDAVLAATTELREESDPYGAFLDDACVVTGDPEDTLDSRELTLAFQFWMMQRAEGAFKERTITLKLKDRSLRWISKKTGQKFTARKSNGQRRYDGIRFTEVFRREWTMAPKDQQGRALNTAAVDTGSDGGAERGIDG